MGSYPDPTLLSRPPNYPYFLDFVATSDSPLPCQTHNFTGPQLLKTSQHQWVNLEDDVGRAEASEHPPGASPRPLGTNEHSLGISAGIAAAHTMSSPAHPMSRKRRRVASQQSQSKRQRLPIVGVFRPPQPPRTQARSPLRTKNTQNANFTAMSQENVLPTLAKHKNTRGQTKSTIIYKENRRGKLVIQKYSHQRSGSVVAVRDKPVHTHKVSRHRGHGQQQLVNLIAGSPHIARSTPQKNTLTRLCTSTSFPASIHSRRGKSPTHGPLTLATSSELH